MDSADFTPGMRTEGTYTPDMLVAGDSPLKTRGVTVASDIEAPRGALLVDVGGDNGEPIGQYVVYDGTDPAEGTLYHIAIEPIDTRDGASTVCGTYYAGDFNANQITTDGDQDLETIRDHLAAQGIHIHNAVPA